MKLAIFTSHPIQYQAPFFKRLAAAGGIDFTVFFNWNFGVGKEQYDPGFGRKIVWDTPLLEGYRYRFLRNWSWNAGSSRFFGEINPGAALEVLRGGYDAVLVYHWSYVTSWLIFLAAFLRGVPVIVRGENPLSHEFLKAPWKLRLKKAVYGWLFRHISAFLYIGEENRKFYEYYGVPRSKLVFSPYAVDNDAFFAAAARLRPRRAELRAKMKLDPALPAILFVGKLIEKKHPFDVLRAYEMLAKRGGAAGATGAGAQLVFVGDGAQRGMLEAYAKEHHLPRVHFAGFRNYSEIEEFYAVSDLLVLPSGAGETWGLVVNEAMCFGLPVVVSDMVGSAPDLAHGTGFTVPLGDVRALAGRLAELIEDEPRRREMGARAEHRIAGYSYAANIEALRMALDKVVRVR